MWANKAGDVSVGEWDWETELGELDPIDGFVPLDVGKIRGLGAALVEAQEDYRACLEAMSDWVCMDCGRRGPFRPVRRGNPIEGDWWECQCACGSTNTGERDDILDELRARVAELEEE